MVSGSSTGNANHRSGDSARVEPAAKEAAMATNDGRGDMPNAYVRVQSCGCITAWCSTKHGDEKTTAKFVSDSVKDGCSVEHVNTAEVQTRPEFMPAECPHDPKGWGATEEAADQMLAAAEGRF